MAIRIGTLWNVLSASVGGSWQMAATGGLLNGVIYVDRKIMDRRDPKGITLRGSLGTMATVQTLDGATLGSTTLTRLEGQLGTLVAYQVSTPDATGDTEGLFQIDAQFTMNDVGGINAYTKDETDSLLSGKLKLRPAAKINKANSGGITTKYPDKLAASASLADVITTLNAVITSATGTQSAAGSAYYAVNFLIDSLMNGEVMQS